MSELTIGDRAVGANHPTYFIADISANHDGDLDRALQLIRLAAEAGADAAKFQNFRAAKIVSDYGFRNMGDQVSHQATWKKSVFEVYEGASIPFDWTAELKAECDLAGIHYFSSPYDFEAVDMLEEFVPAYKIGSGDITWLEMICYMAEKKLPILLATGASSMSDVQRAMQALHSITGDVVLMQCNTNYTASLKNFDHIHLNVLKTYSTLYPEVVLGLSDHTPGHSTVLGGVALGARVVEKHFTDDNDRIGPDHPFSMTPVSWREMVDRTRELERAMGSPLKEVAANELDTVMVQRRCIRAAREIRAGEVITPEMIEVLRPATEYSIKPYEIERVLGARSLKDIPFGKAITWKMLGD
jgi:sialic acid synthase SpsE